MRLVGHDKTRLHHRVCGHGMMSSQGMWPWCDVITEYVDVIVEQRRLEASN